MYDFHRPVRVRLFFSKFTDRRRESEATPPEIAADNHGAEAKCVRYKLLTLAVQVASGCLTIEGGLAALAIRDVLFRATSHIPPLAIATPHGRGHPLPIAKEAIL
jgi:hypothetical protein